MNVLVATSATQGTRPSDFCHVPANDPVGFVFECDHDDGDIDGSCGCRRSMGGLLTRRATTTIQVIDDPTMTPAHLIALVHTFYVRSGWADRLGEAGLYDLLTDEVPELCRIAASFPAGTVLEKRGDQFCARTQPDGAQCTLR